MLRTSKSMVLTAALAASGLAWLPEAHAAQPVPGHSVLVPGIPRTNTPYIPDGEITDIEVSGSTVYVAGSFTSIRNATGTTVAQPRLAAYNIDTGQLITTFRPTFDNEVQEVEASPDGSAIYVVGSFNTVNGVTKRKVVKLNPTTGATITAFTANAGARATAVAVSNTSVYIGGQFNTFGGTNRSGLVAVNPTTGAVDTGFTNNLTGGVGAGGLMTVLTVKLTHDDSKLLVAHTGRQINGQDRYGAALIDTATKTLLPWRTTLYQDYLPLVGGVVRITNADIAPDDSYFVIVSGSGGDRPPVNDTAVKFSITGNDNMQPLWVSRMFDSIYSVAITEHAIYIGGHISFMEAPNSPEPWPGLETQGYGIGQGPGGIGAYALGDQVVRRDHVGALDPVHGWAMDGWNPGSNSFEGVKALEAHPRGLFLGGDQLVVGQQTVGRTAFFDFNNVPAASSVETWIDDPFDGSVVGAGTSFTLGGRATAVAGVNRVQLEIQNSGSKLYLQDDLTTWGAYNGIDAALAVANSTATTWSLPVAFPSGSFTIWARTFATGGTRDATKSSVKIESRLLDDLTPTASFSAPAGGLVAANTFLVTGTAADDSSVSAIRYYLRNGSGQYLQQNGTVGATYNSFSIEPDAIGPTVTWQVELTLADGNWTMYIGAVDDAGQGSAAEPWRDWIVSSTGVAPAVTLTSPVVWSTPPPPAAATPAVPLTVAPGGFLTFAGTATDDGTINKITISLRNTTTGMGLQADGSWAVATTGFGGGSYNLPGVPNTSSVNWSFTTPVALTAGVYTFSVRAEDNLGITTPSTHQGRITITSQVAGDLPPNALLSFTGVDQNVEVLSLNLAGTATDDLGVAAVNMTVRELDTARYLTAAGTWSIASATIPAILASPGATSTSFTLPLTLPTSGEYSITALAVDGSGQLDTSTVGATARYLVYPGDADPSLIEAQNSPATATATMPGQIFVGGRAEDDLAINNVQVRIVNGLGQSLTNQGLWTPTETYLSSFVTSFGSPSSNFNYASPVLPAATYTVYIRAIDGWGQVQQTPRVVTITVT